ncbi:MAG: tape measure protein [Deferribacteres bacterium]|nr:tape measure protein [Deferribacteres bacterium]
MTSIVNLIISAQDKASQIVRKTENGIKKLSGASKAYHDTLQGLNGTADKFMQNMQRIAAVVGIAGVARSFVEINSSAEKTKLMLQGLLGSTEAAAEAFEWILDISTKLPFSIDALKDSYIKLQVAGLDPMSGSLKTLSDAIASFGGTDEDLKLASIAIQQMAGKGVVSMEELRQQLGERIPTAIKAMAEGMGMSMGQLTKEIEKGNISATRGINAMMSKLEEWYGGRGKEMMNSWAGLMSNLRVAWERFALFIGETGVFEKLKSIIDGVLGKLDEMKQSGNLKAWGERIAGTIGRLVDMFVRLGAVIVRVIDIFGPFLPVLIEMFVYFKMTKVILGGIIGLPLSIGRELMALKKAATVLMGTGIAQYFKNLGMVMTTLPAKIIAIDNSLGGLAKKAGLITAAFTFGWQFGKWLGGFEVVRKWTEVAMTYLDEFFIWYRIKQLELWKLTKKVFTLGAADTTATDRQIAALNRHREILALVRKDILKGKDAQEKLGKETEKSTRAIENQSRQVEKQKKTYEELMDSIEEGSSQYIAIKSRELSTFKANIDYEIALEKQKYEQGKISLEEFLKFRQSRQQAYTEEMIRLKEMEIEALKEAPDVDPVKVKAIEEEIKQIKIQSAQDQLKIQQELAQGIKKEHEDAFTNWKSLQELRLDTLKNQFDLENTLDDEAAKQGLLRQSEVLERKLQRTKEFYEARIKLATEALQKIAEIEGTDSEGYKKAYAERLRLQQELEIQVIRSEAQINEARVNEEIEAQKLVADLTDDRIRLAEIEKAEKLQKLKEYHEQGLISAIEYSHAVIALEKKITDSFSSELRERSEQLTVWAGIISERTRRMYDAIGGLVMNSFEDVKQYFGSASDALAITVSEVRAQIEGFLNAINRGTAETFWKAELFGRKMVDMVGTNIYDWASRVAEYIQYVKGLMDDLRDTIEDYRKQLLRLRGDRVGLVEIWYQEQLEKLKSKFKDLADSPEYRQAIDLLRKLYEEKLKKAEESMSKEENRWEKYAGVITTTAENMAGKVKSSVAGIASINLSAISGSLSPEVRVQRDIKLDSVFKIQTFDSETTRRWLRDIVFPEWEKQLRLKGIRL